mmetsp:Transcript_61647/g.147093  ORF Transcript_61647/g.147093 Transcript_61647/m.147093 type:complete len:217 (-) Transcript_61647:766-1416(-)
MHIDRGKQAKAVVRRALATSRHLLHFRGHFTSTFVSMSSQKLGQEELVHEDRSTFRFRLATASAKARGAARCAAPAARRWTEWKATAAGHATQQVAWSEVVPNQVSSLAVTDLDIHGPLHGWRALLVHMLLHRLPLQQQQSVLRTSLRLGCRSRHNRVPSEWNGSDASTEDLRKLCRLQALVDLEATTTVKTIRLLQEVGVGSLGKARNPDIIGKL